MDNIKNDYSDIINLPHHVSKKHPRMPMKDRAAQFAPFAALTGYNDAVKETAANLQNSFLSDGSKKNTIEKFDEEI